MNNMLHKHRWVSNTPLASSWRRRPEDVRAALALPETVPLFLARRPGAGVDRDALLVLVQHALALAQR